MGCGPLVAYSLPGNTYGVMASEFAAEQCPNPLCPVFPSPALLLSASFTLFVNVFLFYFPSCL